MVKNNIKLSTLLIYRSIFVRFFELTNNDINAIILRKKEIISQLADEFYMTRANIYNALDVYYDFLMGRNVPVLKTSRKSGMKYHKKIFRGEDR